MGKAGALVVVVAVFLCTALVRADCPKLGNRVNVPGVGVTQYFYGDGDLTSNCNYDLDGVKSLYFTNGTLKIWSNTPFYNLTSLRGITFAEETKVTVCSFGISQMPGLDTVSFYGSVRVSAGMFRSCHNLMYVRLPSSFTYDSGSPVLSLCSSNYGEGCEDLEGIYIGGNKNGVGENYKVINGALFTLDGKKLIQYPTKKYNPVLYYTIPEGVEQVLDGAVGEYCGIYNLTIPASVARIGDEFRYCDELRRVDYLGVNVPTTDCSIGDDSDLSYVCVPPGYKGDKFCKQPALDCNSTPSSSSSYVPPPPPPPPPRPSSSSSSSSPSPPSPSSGSSDTSVSSSSVVTPSLSLQQFVALASLLVVAFEMLKCQI